MNQSTCYMCCENATSREHVPPSCFFPKPKDFPGASGFRNNLITVPSCQQHNEEKSLYDDYARAVILAHFGNNPLAEKHFSSKVVRALRRSSGFAITVAGSIKPVVLNGQQTGAIQIDNQRLFRSLRWIARGVAFSHTGVKWLDKIVVHILPLRDGQMNRPQALDLIFDLAQLATDPLEWHGENPAVFQYKWIHHPVQGSKVLKMQFYGGFDVIAISGSNSEGAVD